MSKLTLEEKRLTKLRQQLFGKEDNTPELKNSSHTFTTSKIEIPNTTHTPTATMDASYLKKDLIKTALLTILALSFQFILFWSLQNNLLKLKF